MKLKPKGLTYWWYYRMKLYALGYDPYNSGLRITLVRG